MKKTFLRSAAALLLLSAAVSCVGTSCGDAEEAPKPVETKKTTEAVVESDTEESAKNIDSIGKLSELDFGGQKLTIDISINEDEWNTSAVYVMGAEEEIGDEAKDLVYRRNAEIADALNVSIDWIQTDLGFPDVFEHIQKPVLMGDSTVDLYINDQHGLISSFTAGYLYNVADLDEDETYFDFSTDGWYNEYMDDLSILEGKRYFLVGDYFMDVLRSTHVMYFNKNLMASLFEGPDELYDTVLAGAWTYDKLIGYVKDCYQDLNGDGAVDRLDLYGVRMHKGWSNLFFNTTDCRTVSKDQNGVLYIDPSIERTSALADRLVALYTSPGYFNMNDSEGTKERIEYFVNGQVMFAVWLKLADLETDEMRNMDGVGMVPYPKLDESQDTYRTLVHDVAELGAIPTSVDEGHLPALSAYLQAMTQYTAKHVMPQYFETSLKIKYSQDEQSAQMLDIIRDGIRCAFEYAYSGYFSTIGTQPLQNSILKKGNIVASSMEKGMKKAESQLEKLQDALDELE